MKFKQGDLILIFIAVLLVIDGYGAHDGSFPYGRFGVYTFRWVGWAEMLLGLLIISILFYKRYFKK